MRGDIHIYMKMVMISMRDKFINITMSWIKQQPCTRRNFFFFIINLRFHFCCGVSFDLCYWYTSIIIIMMSVGSYFCCFSSMKPFVNWVWLWWKWHKNRWAMVDSTKVMAYKNTHITHTPSLFRQLYLIKLILIHTNHWIETKSMTFNKVFCF